MKQFIILSLLSSLFVLGSCESRKTRAEIEADFARFTETDSDTLMDVQERKTNRNEDPKVFQTKTLEELKKEEEAAKRRQEEDEALRQAELERAAQDASTATDVEDAPAMESSAPVTTTETTTDGDGFAQ